jgi:hypothetical protein
VLRLGTEGVERVRHGMTVSALEIAGEVPDVLPGRPCRLLDPQGELLGVGVAVEGLSEFRPLVVLASPRRAASRASGSGKTF